MFCKWCQEFNIKDFESDQDRTQSRLELGKNKKFALVTLSLDSCKSLKCGYPINRSGLGSEFITRSKKKHRTQSSSLLRKESPACQPRSSDSDRGINMTPWKDSTPQTATDCSWTFPTTHALRVFESVDGTSDETEGKKQIPWASRFPCTRKGVWVKLKRLKSLWLSPPVLGIQEVGSLWTRKEVPQCTSDCKGYS